MVILPAKRRRCSWLAAAWLLLTVSVALADLRGSADVTANRTDSDDGRRESLRQDYNLSWSRLLTTYVDLRAGVRYFEFDQGADLALSTYRQEFRPSAELAWRHPLFVFAARGFHREAEASALTGNLTTDDLQLSLETRDASLPRLGVRYEQQHIYDTVAGFDRDVRDELFQTSVDHAADHDNLHYRYRHRDTENVISGVESTRHDHSARWIHRRSFLDGDRVGLQLSYNFEYSEQTDRVAAAGRVLEPVPLATALYAADETPALATLEPRPELSDGDTSLPALPPIDIGGATAGRNLGADLGFERPVASVHVYTDGLSGPEPTWRLFVSDDNLVWTPRPFTAPVEFNAALSRYEFAFDEVTTRYVKVVKDGTNRFLDVLVAEVDVLQEVRTAGEQTRIGRAHVLATRASARLGDRLDTALDASLMQDDGAGPLGDRTRVDYAARARWLQSTSITHAVRWTQSFQEFGGQPDQRDDTAAYTLRYEPRETITVTADVSSRWRYADGRPDQELRSASLEFNGRPVPLVRFTLGGNVSHIENPVVASRSDVATLRSRLEGTVHRSLDLTTSYTYQDVSSHPGPERIRRVADVALVWRLTSAIFARGRVNWTRDVVDHENYDALLSWRLAPRLSVTGQVYVDRAETGRRSERYAAGATYEFGPRTTLYLRWNENDLREAGGLYTETLQVGLRTSF